MAKQQTQRRCDMAKQMDRQKQSARKDTAKKTADKACGSKNCGATKNCD